ncbi:hypothetical protein V8E36_001310 [Tilletia maclaganii]
MTSLGSINLDTLLRNDPVYTTLDPDTISRLSEMLSAQPLPSTPYFYHSCTFILFVILWALAALISKALASIYQARFTTLTYDQRRTMEIYVLNIILTTVAALLQFAAIGAFSLQFYAWQFNIIRAVAILISANYCCEMLYRPRMRAPMIAHHILTLFITMLSMSVLYANRNPTMMLSGTMLLFLATLEQPTFIALFLYRLRYPTHTVKRWLYYSSIQTIACKSLAALGAVIVWGRWQVVDRGALAKAYDVLFVLAIVGLYVTQWWGASVTWKMSRTIEQRYGDDNIDQEKHGRRADVAVDAPTAPGQPGSALPTPRNASDVGFTVEIESDKISITPAHTPGSSHGDLLHQPYRFPETPSRRSSAASSSTTSLGLWARGMRIASPPRNPLRPQSSPRPISANMETLADPAELHSRAVVGGVAGLPDDRTAVRPASEVSKNTLATAGWQQVSQR